MFLKGEHQQEWAGEIPALLLEIKQAVKQAKEQGGLPARQQNDFEARCDQLILIGLAAKPSPGSPGGKQGRKKQSKAKNLFDRLQGHKCKDTSGKCWRSWMISTCCSITTCRTRYAHGQTQTEGLRLFRTFQGAQTFCQIRGYISTARKNGLRAFEALQMALNGMPFYPDFLQLLKADSAG